MWPFQEESGVSTGGCLGLVLDSCFGNLEGERMLITIVALHRDLLLYWIFHYCKNLLKQRLYEWYTWTKWATQEPSWVVLGQCGGVWRLSQKEANNSD